MVRLTPQPFFLEVRGFGFGGKYTAAWAPMSLWTFYSAQV